MESSSKKRIGILRGGVGKHYASSLQRGGEIISYIFENLGDKYKTLDILVDKENIWHLNGVPIIPTDLLQRVDIVWNASHSSFSNILKSLSIPHVGDGAFSAALQSNKIFLREHIKSIGVQMPRYIISPKSAKEVFEKFSSPWTVKFFNETKVVKTFSELVEAIDGKSDVVVEEFIAGKVATVHSVPNFRGQEFYNFPLGVSYGVFSDAEKEKLFNLAKDIHKHVGAKYYLKSDFILTPRGKVYLLQVEDTPDFKKNSHLSQVAESVGAKMQHIVENMLEQAQPRLN